MTQSPLQSDREKFTLLTFVLQRGQWEHSPHLLLAPSSSISVLPASVQNNSIEKERAGRRWGLCSLPPLFTEKWADCAGLDYLPRSPLQAPFSSPRCLKIVCKDSNQTLYRPAQSPLFTGVVLLPTDPLSLPYKLHFKAFSQCSNACEIMCFLALHKNLLPFADARRSH